MKRGFSRFNDISQFFLRDKHFLFWTYFHILYMKLLYNEAIATTTEYGCTN